CCRRVRGHRQRDRRYTPQARADIRAGPGGEADLRPRVRDLPHAVRDARSLRGTADARAEANPHGKESSMSRLPRIGLLGIMQELYDDMIPGITDRQGRYAESVAERLAPVADVTFPRPARNRDDVEAI